MCRSKDQGGRRCPCGDPRRRAAYRRALKARRSTEAEINSDEESTPVEEHVESAEVEPPVVERYQDYESVKNLLTSEEMNDPEYRQKVIDEFGGLIDFTRHVGRVVSAEALSRQGINVDEEIANNQEYMISQQKELDDLHAQVKEKNNLIRLARSEARDRITEEHPEYSLKEMREATVLDPKVVALQAQIDEAGARIHHLVRHENALNGGTYGPNLMKKAADGYMEVLKEIRSFDGDHEWDSTSSKKDVKTFNNALKYYPSDWIRVSDEDGYRPKVKTTKARAHYSPSKKQTQRVHGPLVSVVEKDEDISSRPDLVPLTNDDGTPKTETFHTYDENNMSVTVEARVAQVAAVSKKRLADEYTDEDMKELKPSGRGWQLYRNDEIVCWRKPLTEVTTRSFLAPEITTNDNSYEEIPGVTGRDATAIHELAHRFEFTKREIMVAENQYLMSRVSEGERIQPIYEFDEDEEPEMGYRDHFLDHYMGKVYTSGSREVMSVGMESIFGGKNGGLIGMSKDGRKDEDMRDFVLGALVTIK